MKLTRGERTFFAWLGSSMLLFGPVFALIAAFSLFDPDVVLLVIGVLMTVFGYRILLGLPDRNNS